MPQTHGGPSAAEVVSAFLAYAQATGLYSTPESYYQRSVRLLAFAAALRDKPAAACRKSDLEVWLHAQKGWGDWTRKAAVNVVQRCFNWAADDGLVERNPFQGVRWREGRPRRAMTEAEFRSMLRASDALFRRVLLFMSLTGCRTACEVGRLLWTDIDFEAGVAVSWKGKTTRQTGKPRVIRLPPAAVKLLRWLQRNRVPDQEHVFINSRGNAWDKNALASRVQTLRKRCGIDASCKLYGIRHAWGTRAVVNGVDLKTVAELMGHTTTHTTERYYVDLSKENEHLRRAAEQAIGGKPFPPRRPAA